MTRSKKLPVRFGLEVWIDYSALLDDLKQELKPMAVTLDQVKTAITDLRSALEQEKTEIADKISQLETKLSSAEIPEEVLSELQSLTGEIRGIVETPMPEVPAEVMEPGEGEVIDPSQPLETEAEPIESSEPTTGEETPL